MLLPVIILDNGRAFYSGLNLKVVESVLMTGIIGNQWTGVILAAGRGSRMKSRLPKVLHQVCGRELIKYPVELMRQLEINNIIIVVSPENIAAIQQTLGDGFEYVVQYDPKGTGDALERAMPMILGGDHQVLVMNGDVPLLRSQSVEKLCLSHSNKLALMSLLTVSDVIEQELGIIHRDIEGRITHILEAADGPDFESDSFLEANVGVYCFDPKFLGRSINKITSNKSGERYITSLAAIADEDGTEINAENCSKLEELLGVNNRVELSRVEAIERQRILEHWMLEGVTIQDPASVYIDHDVVIGQDSIIFPNTALRGTTQIGEDCQIGPNSLIDNSVIGDRNRIICSHLESSTIESGVTVGPFSHLRPGSHLESNVYIGNYVEVKNTWLAEGSVAGHFSYLGDATIGSDVNIGAGTITCNFDGINKHNTLIEPGAFIGCDTLLVAPVTVGARASTGAGSVVIKDVPESRLVVGVPARIIR